jgi:hypothetical protein
MKENIINCEHACKNTCATIEEAVKREESLVILYQSALNECNIPDINSLMSRMITNSKSAINELNQKLIEVKSASGIIDDIEKSYDTEDM